MSRAGTLSTSSDSCFYTFVIPMPDVSYTTDKVLFECNLLYKHNHTETPYYDQCVKLLHLVETVYRDTDKVIVLLNDTVDKIKTVIPEHKPEDNREASTLFSFLGDVLEFVAGNPSEKSFKKVKDHVTILETNEYYLEKSVGRLGQDLDAFSI